MSLVMIKYHMLKNLIDKLDNNIIKKINYDDNLLFNYASFNDLASYYTILNPFKIDKYNIDSKLKAEEYFYPFIINCIKECKEHDSYDELLFLYAILSNFLIDKNIRPYIFANTTKTNYYTSSNMLDYYYSSLYYKIDLSKDKLSSIFENSFIIHPHQINLINEPMIKSIGFLCSNNYYHKCIKRYKYYLTHLTTSKHKIKYFFFKIYDIFRRKNKRKATSFIYFKHINVELLNKLNKPYLINEKTYNYSIDQVFDNVLSELLSYIESINQYMFNNNSKPLKLKLPKDYTNLISLKNPQ